MPGYETCVEFIGNRTWHMVSLDCPLSTPHRIYYLLPCLPHPIPGESVRDFRGGFL